MIFLFNKLKIFFILIISFIVSQFSIDNVFLAQSPKVNPFFISNTIAKVNSIWSKSANFIASFSPFSKFNFQLSNNLYNRESASSQNRESASSQNNFNLRPQPTSVSSEVASVDNINKAPKEVLDALTVPLKKVSQGVYAGEKNNIKVYKIKMNEIDYLEYTFNIKGKEIKVKVPKGEQPPTQEEIELFFE